MSNEPTIRMDGDGDPDKTQITPIDLEATIPSEESASGTPGTPKTNPRIGDTDVFDQREAEGDSFIGQTLGNYHILNKLGAGGFGTVYKARDVKLDRHAAVKFLTAPMNTDYSKLFEREAKILANLSKNPNIVQIYGWGEHKGSNYMVLEFMDYSLEAKMEEHPDGMPLKEALTVIAHCCDALQYAHNEGVLHRDIKPANILIDQKTNQVKVCDFGLARFYNKGIESATQTIAGSPPFMSIEQITGKNLDERSDVYSLGVTLYQVLSGNLPFSGSSQFEIMEKIRSNNSTPLPKQRADLPRIVYDIVKKAMAYSADDRFQSAESFGKALRKAADAIERTGSADSVTLDPDKPKFPAWAAAAIVVIVAGAAFVGVSSMGGPEGGGTIAVPVVAQAAELVDNGHNRDAITALEEYVAENPTDEANHLLAHAYQRDGQVDKADEIAAMIEDAKRKSEVQAAVAFERDGSQSRATLEQLASASPDIGYIEVLLAQLDMNQKNAQAAVDRLQNMEALQFYYDWQRYKAQQVLGQAYYDMQQLDKAAAVFGSLQESAAANPNVSRVAEKYYELAKRQQDTEDLKAFQEQIKFASETIKKDENFDSWTSRPIRVAVNEAVVDEKLEMRLAEAGMPDVFADELNAALLDADGMPVTVLDRQKTSEIVKEQSLVSTIGDGQSKLAQLMGVRVFITPEFNSAFDGENLQLKLTDAETSQVVRVPDRGKVPIPASNASVEEWYAFFDKAQTLVRNALTGEFILQGILTQRDGRAYLNIGSEVGVKPGDTFAVHRQPNTAEINKDYLVTVTDEIGPNECRVELTELNVESIPETGLYAKQKVDS